MPNTETTAVELSQYDIKQKPIAYENSCQYQ